MKIVASCLKRNHSREIEGSDVHDNTQDNVSTGFWTPGCSRYVKKNLLNLSRAIGFDINSVAGNPCPECQQSSCLQAVRTMTDVSRLCGRVYSAGADLCTGKRGRSRRYLRPGTYSDI